jgi:hypothetical protein
MLLNISCLIVMLRLPGKSTGKSALQSLSPVPVPCTMQVRRHGAVVGSVTNS